MAAKHVVFHATRDARLQAELVEAYRPMAAALASRYGHHHEPQDDLTQAALVGLLHALDRFEPDRGVEFTTFAWATISGELKRHYRDQTWGVRVPRSLKELFRAASQATDELTVELGRSPTIAEIAYRAGATEEDVIQALEVRGAYLPMSLDAPAADDRGTILPEDDHGYSAIDEHELLSPLVARLPARQRQILHLRFVEEMTQSQIGQALDISQMHVCRLLADSLATLRQWIEEPALPA